MNHSNHTFLSGIAAAMAICASTTLATAQSTQPLPELYGSVIYADGWTTYNNEIGIYRIGTSDDIPFTKLSNHKVMADGGGTVIGDTYWACHFVDPYYCDVSSYDTSTWKETSFKYADYPAEVEHCVISTAVVYDRTTGKTYGCFRNDNADGYEFGTVDYTTLKRTTIKAIELPWSAISVTRQGQLYAIDDNGILFTIDKNTGAMTRVGDTGLIASHPSSACIDPRTGRMFYAITRKNANAIEGALYEISLTDAKATRLYQFPRNEEIVGMYVPVPNVDDDAPDAVADLTLDFPNGTLSGTVSFKMPATNFIGGTGIGNLTYTITANGQEIVPPTAAGWGEQVNAKVTLPEAATYTITVTPANPFGNGPKADAEMFIGVDTPVTPNLTADISGSEITLRWSPVTESVNGGYIDLPNLTYRVTRYPDETILAEATKQTEIKDNPDTESGVTGYYYTVVANAGTSASEAATSPTFWLGTITPPYNMAFDTPESTGAYTFVDANNDGITWSWSASDKAFQSQWNRQKNSDDWLITPGIRLESGKTYTVTAKMHTYLGNPEQLEICYGTSPDPAMLTEKLMDKCTIKHRDSKDYELLVTPENDGTYYIGIHVVTPGEEAWKLYVEALSVNAGVAADIPDAVADFTVTPAADGSKTAEISLYPPTQNLNGSPAGDILRIDLMRDGVKITDFKLPEAGKKLSYTDNVPAGGYYTYEAVAFNATGKGKKSSVRKFIGINEPATPKWVTLTETGNPGEVKMEWEQVTTDKDGEPLSPSHVTYTIITLGDNDEIITIAKDLRTTAHTFKVEGADREQKFVVYVLRAVTEGGESLRIDTPTIPVGKPYDAPYTESFANGYAASILRSENYDGTWSVYDGTAGIPTQDNDGGMAAMFAENAGADAWLYSGKISLAGLSNPALSFYAYNITGNDPDLNEIEVSLSDGTGFKPLHKAVMSQIGETDGWHLVNIPLTAYAGKQVQFALHAITRTRQYTLIDNIRIGENQAGSIDNIAASANTAVTALPGAISVTGASGLNLMVCDTQGRTIASTYVTADAITLPVAPGLYIVRLSDGTARKILVP